MDNDSTNKFPEFITSHGAQLAYRYNPAKGNNETQENDQPAHVVFCGGFHSNMLGIKAQKLAEICSTHNISYTRFDYRGHGESEGAPAAFDLQDWLNDILTLIDNIREPVILVGSSMGGWLASIAASHRISQIKGLLLIAAAPNFIQELIQPRLSKEDTWNLQQGLVVTLPNQYDSAFPITQKLVDSAHALSVLNEDISLGSKPDFFDDLETTKHKSEQSPNQLITGINLSDNYVKQIRTEPAQNNMLQALSCPIRLIHGTYDEDVPFDFSIRLMRKFTNAESRLTLLNQADHRLSDPRSLDCIETELLTLIQLTSTADEPVNATR